MSGHQEPTATKTLRNEFRIRVSKPLRALKGAIRTTLIDNDALRLKQDSDQLFSAAGDITPSGGFVFRTDAEAKDEFLRWLDEQVERGLLERTERTRIRNGEHFTASYIRSAYQRGVDHADAQLNKHGVEVSEEALQSTFNAPVHQDTLQGLYTRTYDDLETVAQRMQTNVRRELTTGLSQGWGPRKVARNLNQRVDVGITESERLARTEILHAHNTANRTRYGEYGVGKVDILGSNPCSKICAPIIANNPYPLNDIPNGGCPLHPNCVGTEAPATDSSGNIIRASATDVARTAA